MEQKHSIEQSLSRIHKLRDALHSKIKDSGEVCATRAMGASKVWILNIGEGFIDEFSIETVSEGKITQDTEEFTVKFATGKDLAQTLESLAQVADQFLEREATND